MEDFFDGLEIFGPRILALSVLSFLNPRSRSIEDCRTLVEGVTAYSKLTFGGRGCQSQG
ncbi:hypothetical protein [Halothece sp. PCC 7418]|uniref:hypothetical protein n=1 Tax=Halothece sp. (strain PCC 7418) TaxID=65093 RepID=UPI00031CE9A6|nr:hypothetical protein [Halothece sp. PCC 7418]